MSNPELPEIISVTALARLLGVTDRRCRQLADEGLVLMAGRGSVRLAESLRRIIENARDSRAGEGLTAARARVAEAKARAQEIANHRADRQLVDVDEAHALMAELAGLLVAGLEALPARIGGRDIGLRRRVEKECDAVRRQVVEKFERGLP